MSRLVTLTAFGLLVLSVFPLRAAETNSLQAMLERPIVGPALPMMELERYCEARVPHMPAIKTVAQWEAEAGRLRAAVLDRVVFRGEAARWRDAPTKTQWLDTLPGGPGYRIKKLRFEALPGMWIPALLYEPEKLSGKVPVILNVNGHVGPPGKSVAYKQIRCINQAKRGMLALNVEWLGMGQLGGPGFQHGCMNQLDLCGTSGVAPFYLSMKRSLDLLLSLPNVDPNRVAVTGLSGGGWQTIFISALDPRVTLANPVAGYSSVLTRIQYLTDLGDSEQAPCDLASLADYTHLTAMRAPRPTLLTKNAKDDCCFAAGHSLAPLMEAARPIFALYGRQDALRSHVNDNPGTHNYESDNRQAFYRMLGDFFYPHSKDFDPKEIACQSEVKSQKELDVALPATNEDFHSLALRLSKELPRQADPPRDEAGLNSWRRQRRALLCELVKAKDYEVKAVESGREEKQGIRFTFWRLQIGGAWTVPAVEMARGAAGKTTLIVADAGRTATAPAVERLLAEGYRVLAVDPFYLGESKIAEKSYLWMLLVGSLGERPLGIQASQIAAVARWSLAQSKTGPVTLVAIGPRSSAAALVAAALEDKAVGQVDLRQPLTSLKDVIQRNGTFDQTPELFCFGLLERFDLSTLKALVAPRQVKQSPSLIGG
ncbi:MAG: alpha/beta hydrolase family protein [Thermoguttaceae bacterium]